MKSYERRWKNITRGKWVRQEWKRWKLLRDGYKKECGLENDGEYGGRCHKIKIRINELENSEGDENCYESWK